MWSPELDVGEYVVTLEPLVVVPEHPDGALANELGMLHDKSVKFYGWNESSFYSFVK